MFLYFSRSLFLAHFSLPLSLCWSVFLSVCYFFDVPIPLPQCFVVLTCEKEQPFQDLLISVIDVHTHFKVLWRIYIVIPVVCVCRIFFCFPRPVLHPASNAQFSYFSPSLSFPSTPSFFIPSCIDLYPHTLLLSFTSHALLSYSFLNSSILLNSLFRSLSLFLLPSSHSLLHCHLFSALTLSPGQAFLYSSTSSFYISSSALSSHSLLQSHLFSSYRVCPCVIDPIAGEILSSSLCLCIHLHRISITTRAVCIDHNTCMDGLSVIGCVVRHCF